MTEAEQKLWWHLRRISVNGSHFRRQATIGPYFADFACHEQRLVIEVDGAGHSNAEVISADSKRTDYLQSQGYRVLRFWNNEIMKNIEGVLIALQQAVAEQAAQSPPPLTPPRRAEPVIGRRFAPARWRGGRGSKKS